MYTLYFTCVVSLRVCISWCQVYKGSAVLHGVMQYLHSGTEVLCWAMHGTGHFNCTREKSINALFYETSDMFVLAH
jgi:hypothetical protein